MALFKQEYDPEVNMWVARRAREVGEEVRSAPYRKGILNRRRKPITIYDQYGKPIAKVKIHDTGSTEQEFDNHQDANARPLSVVPKTKINNGEERLWVPRFRRR